MTVIIRIEKVYVLSWYYGYYTTVGRCDTFGPRG